MVCVCAALREEGRGPSAEGSAQGRGRALRRGEERGVKIGVLLRGGSRWACGGAALRMAHGRGTVGVLACGWLFWRHNNGPCCLRASKLFRAHRGIPLLPRPPRLPATSSPPPAKVSQRTVCTALLSGLVITAGAPLHVCVATVWRAGAERGRGQGEESASGIFLHKELTIFISRLD